MQMQMGVPNRRLAGMLKARLPEAALDDVTDPRRRRLWSLGSLLRTFNAVSSDIGAYLVATAASSRIVSGVSRKASANRSNHLAR